MKDTKKTKDIQKPGSPTINELEELLGSKERTLFYITWLKHNRNATQAYLELHPKVTYNTARTLGARMLANIDMKVIARAYGLDEQAYFEQLAKGLVATKRDHFSGEMSEDHNTRKAYHDKLGKLLGLEQDKGTQINVAAKDMKVEFIAHEG